MVALGSLSGYTLSVGMIGTNNQQIGQNHSLFKQDILDILALMASYNIPSVIGTSPTMYSIVQAAVQGGAGATTSNAGGGSQYRDTLMKAVADKRATLDTFCTVVDMGRAMPPPLPQYLAWTGVNGRTDPIVYDNVHPTMRARMYQGWAMAKAAFGLLCPRVTSRLIDPKPFETSWFTTAGTGWLPVASPWQSHWSVSPDGTKNLRCFFSTAGATIADATTVVQLPLALAPSATTQNLAGGRAIGPAWSGQTNPSHVEVQTDGGVKVYGVDAVNKWISFNISYT